MKKITKKHTEIMIHLAGNRLHEIAIDGRSSKKIEEEKSELNKILNSLKN